MYFHIYQHSRVVTPLDKVGSCVDKHLVQNYMSKQEIIIQNNCLFQLLSLLLFHLRYTPYLALAPKRTMPSLSTFVYVYLNHWVILLHVHQLQLLNTRNCHFFRSI